MENSTMICPNMLLLNYVFKRTWKSGKYLLIMQLVLHLSRVTCENSPTGTLNAIYLSAGVTLSLEMQGSMMQIT